MTLADDTDELLRYREHLISLCDEIAEWPQPTTEEGMVGPYWTECFTNDDTYVPGGPRSTFQEDMRPGANEKIREMQHFSLRLGENMTRL